MSIEKTFKSKSSTPIFITLFGTVIPWLLKFIDINKLSLEKKYALGLAISISSLFAFALYYYYRLNDLTIEAYNIKSEIEIIKSKSENYKTLYEFNYEENKALRAENIELKKIIQSYHLNSSKE